MKKKGGGGDGPNWMDTYGDMVTLLLCFFVLLYSMSTVSEDKWRAIVQSFNPSALETTTETSGNDGPLADPSEGLGFIADQTDISQEELEEMQEEVDQAIEELYETLKAFVEDNDMGQSIEVTKGDGYVFISFNDAVFFDGDSAVLRADGKRVLDVVSDAINTAAQYIDEIRVMGHTARARSDRANTIVGDRMLASNRATNALIYIQERTVDHLSPARLVSMGYGEFRPIDTNDNEEGRIHNRRVEILITGQNLLDQLGDSIQQYYSTRSGESPAGAESSAGEG